MICARINGNSYPLAFTLAAMDGIEDATGKSVGELSLRMKSKADRVELMAVLAVLMREGAAAGEETPTAEELRTIMTPGELLASLTKVSNAISEGMHMETEDSDEDDEVDVVLEEIKKKEAPGD